MKTCNLLTSLMHPPFAASASSDNSTKSNRSLSLFLLSPLRRELHLLPLHLMLRLPSESSSDSHVQHHKQSPHWHPHLGHSWSCWPTTPTPGACQLVGWTRSGHREDQYGPDADDHDGLGICDDCSGGPLLVYDYTTTSISILGTGHVQWLPRLARMLRA